MGVVKKERNSHRKGSNKEAIFYFGDRFCYVNESFFWVGGSGTQYYKLRTSSDEFAESVTVYWPSQFPDSFLVRT